MGGGRALRRGGGWGTSGERGEGGHVNIILTGQSICMYNCMYIHTNKFTSFGWIAYMRCEFGMKEK